MPGRRRQSRRASDRPQRGRRGRALSSGRRAAGTSPAQLTRRRAGRRRSEAAASVVQVLRAEAAGNQLDHLLGARQPSGPVAPVVGRRAGIRPGGTSDRRSAALRRALERRDREPDCRCRDRGGHGGAAGDPPASAGHPPDGRHPDRLERRGPHQLGRRLDPASVRGTLLAPVQVALEKRRLEQRELSVQLERHELGRTITRSRVHLHSRFDARKPES